MVRMSRNRRARIAANLNDLGGGLLLAGIGAAMIWPDVAGRIVLAALFFVAG